MPATRNASAEEADCVAALIRELLDDGEAWVDREGVRKSLALQDVLVVAPYNAYVAVLRSTLPANVEMATRKGLPTIWQGLWMVSLVHGSGAGSGSATNGTDRRCANRVSCFVLVAVAHAACDLQSSYVKRPYATAALLKSSSGRRR